MTATVSEVLTRAATLLDKGHCRRVNARLEGGKACGVFDRRAAAYSMYGALCAVLGPGLGDDKALQASPAWKVIALRARAALDEIGQFTLYRDDFALHELNDHLPDFYVWEVDGKNVYTPSGAPAKAFREWAADPEIIALGEWQTSVAIGWQR